MPLRVIGGELKDVTGPARRFGGWMFIPSAIELEGGSYAPECDLRDEPGAAAAAGELREYVRRRLDAIWVRSRLKAAFGIDSPAETDRPEKSLMYFGFCATLASEPEISYVFECSDYYGKAQLCFGETQPDHGTRDAIGTAFWGLLLAEPDALADYEDRAFHSGAGVWMHYGRRNGALFYEELEQT